MIKTYWYKKLDKYYNDAYPNWYFYHCGHPTALYPWGLYCLLSNGYTAWAGQYMNFKHLNNWINTFGNRFENNIQTFSNVHNKIIKES